MQMAHRLLFGLTLAAMLVTSAPAHASNFGMGGLVAELLQLFSGHGLGTKICLAAHG